MESYLTITPFKAGLITPRRRARDAAMFAKPDAFLTTPEVMSVNALAEASLPPSDDVFDPCWIERARAREFGPIVDERTARWTLGDRVGAFDSFDSARGAADATQGTAKAAAARAKRERERERSRERRLHQTEAQRESERERSRRRRRDMSPEQKEVLARAKLMRRRALKLEKSARETEVAETLAVCSFHQQLF